MRRVAEQLKAAGDTIEDALGQLAEQADVGAQVLALRQSLLTEKRIADDRHETNAAKLDVINAKLDRILAQLGMNGSGGHG